MDLGDGGGGDRRPELGEVILDPACGTGGFLVESFKHLEKQCRTVEDRKILQTQSIFGGEAKPLPYLLAQMNLVLHGLESPKIDPLNSLRFPLREIGDRDRVERRVTLPDVECERCTLQVIQFTYGLPIARATYHQCVDLVLDASAPGIHPGSTDPGSIDSGSGDREGDDAEGPALDSDDGADTASGCSLSRSAGPGGPGSRGALPRGATLLASAAALALAGRRTRRRHGG